MEPETSRSRSPFGVDRAVARALAVACAGVVLLGVMPSGSQAQPVADPALIDALLADPDAASDRTPDPLALGSAMDGARALLPESVRDIPVDSAALTRTESEILSLETAILTNRQIRDEAIVDLARLEGERQSHRARISAQNERRRVAGRVAEDLRGELGELAVAAYMGAGDPAPGLTLSPDTATEAGRQRVLVETVDLTLRDRLAAAEAEIRAAALQVDEARGSLQRIIEAIDLTTLRRDAAIAELSAAEPALPLTQSRYHDQFMTARVRGADFTVVALHAYRSAAQVVNAELPACRVTWSILAGIGRVESRHGTYAGAAIRADGSTSRRIIGIALDGSPGVMLIPDTDGGALDGDAVYDRAVGPMQFIPSTWRMVRRDGNGNGRMDPHNLYDAAAAAGAYLCRNGLRLDRPSELNRAILSYNRSQPYVEQVIGHRRSYERLRLPE